MSGIHYSEQAKQIANEADIVSYLQTHGETVRQIGREHQWESPNGKVSIRGSKWYSQYEQVGGGAVGFVQKYFGKTYPDAIKDLLEGKGSFVVPRREILHEREYQNRIPRQLVPPPKNRDTGRVYSYLTFERGIDPEIARYFLGTGLIYEDADYHNAVFVGADQSGIPRHFHKRSTDGISSYKGNVGGSLSSFSFHYVGTSEKLYVFEAPIDLLAYLSLHRENWKQHSYVALCSTAPHAAVWMLRTYDNLKNVYLCLDHDPAGIEGAYRVADSIHDIGEYSVYRIMPENKDFDEDLKARRGIRFLPACEHPWVEQVRETAGTICSGDGDIQKMLRRFRMSKSYLNEDFLRDVERFLDLGEYEHVAKVVLAYLACRHPESETEKFFGESRKLICACYRPNRDHDDSETQRFELNRNFEFLRRDLLNENGVSGEESARRDGPWVRFLSDCIRLICHMEREQELEAAEEESQLVM